MKSKLFFIIIIVFPLLVSCTNEETLDRAFTIGAETTANVLLDECNVRYGQLPIAQKEAKILAENGLNRSREYFISIDDKKWIDEALEIASSSLEAVSVGMTKDKCISMANAIVKDGGVIKSIRHYYK